MRILGYPDELSIGGAHVVALTMVRALRERGHEVLLYSAPGPLLAVAERDGIEFVARRALSARPDPLAVAQLTRLAARRRVDAALSFGPVSAVELFLGPHLLGGRRVAAGVYPMPTVGLPPYFPATEPVIVGRADLAERLRRERPGPVARIPPPIDVMPLPVDGRARFRARFSVPGDAELVVLVSRLPADDRLLGQVDALLDAVPYLAARGRIRVVLVGDGPGRAHVEARARECNDGAGRPVVSVVGELLDVHDAYAAADVVVAMGTSALLGIAAGLPVVVMAGDGRHELGEAEAVRRYRASGAFAAVDAPAGSSSLAARIADLLDDPPRARRAAAVAAPLVAEHWGADRVAAAVEDLLHDLPPRSPDAWRDAAHTVRSYAMSRAASLRSRARRRGSAALRR